MDKPLSIEIKEQKKRPVFLVMTGPIGVGKDSVFAELMKRNPEIARIITTTARPMREGEAQGKPLYFVAQEKFEEMIADGEFLEWVEFRGTLHGTQKKTIQGALDSGKDIIWHIEAKGIKNIKHKIKNLPVRSVFVYLSAPSIEDLEKRVKKDEGKSIHHRWNESLVKWSMDQYDDCEYLVVNEDGKLDNAVEEIQCIMEAKRLEIRR